MKDLFISRKTMFVSLGLFVGGLICCLLDYLPGFNNIIDLKLVVMGLIANVWIVDLGRKMTHRHIRIYAYFVGVLIILWIVLQYSKYRATHELPEVERYLWYSFYIPIILIPLFLFHSSLYFGKNDNFQVSRWWQVCGIFALALIALVMTNDLHHLVFIFGPENSNDNYKYNIVYFIIILWNAIFLIATLVNALRYVTNRAYKAFWFVPFIFLAIGVAYMLYLSLGNRLDWFLSFSEMYWIMIITFFESLCAIKFIPTSVGYELYFDKSSINTIIIDRNLQPIFVSNQVDISNEIIKESLNSPVSIDENTKIKSKPIKGGYVVYSEDLTSLNNAKHRLEKYNAELFEHNELLKSENELLAKEAGIKVNEDIYSKIFDFIRNEYDVVTSTIETLDAEDPRFFEKIKLLNIYDSYIKRISNLILLTERNPYLSLVDLEYSLNETFEYLNLKGIAASFKISSSDTFILSTSLVEIYYDIWSLVSKNIDSLDSIFVTVIKRDDGIAIRMMVEGDVKTFERNEYERMEEDSTVFSRIMNGVVRDA